MNVSSFLEKFDVTFVGCWKTCTALQAPNQKYRMSRSRINESTISLRSGHVGLGVILRVIRLKVSVWISSYIKLDLKSLFGLYAQLYSSPADLATPPHPRIWAHS
jgi:hypothetical protein